jgi:peptidase C25-like protein
MKRLAWVGLLACVCAAPSFAAPPPAQLQEQFALAAQPAMKVLVQKDGWYRVSFASLRKAGFGVSAKTVPRLQLFTDAMQVPVQVERGALEFYGQALDTHTADTRTYWLVAGKSRGLRIGVLRAGAQAAPPRGWFPATVSLKPRENYLPSLTNGVAQNFLGPAVRTGKVTRSKFATPHLAHSGSGSLRVSVQGVSLVSHSVRVSLNGRALGTLSFKSDTVGTATYRIPATLLKSDAGNTIALAATGGELDFGFVESVQIKYPHSFVADADVLSFPVRAGQRVSIGGFSVRPRVFDISRPERPREVVPTVTTGAEGYTIGVRAPAGATRLLALTEKKFASASLSRNAPSSLNRAGRGVDLLVLSHRTFIPSLKPLVELRRQQGLTVGIVDVEDVYDEFGFGTHGPQPIKDFLKWTSDQQRAPRYVLLVGDATYDPRNFTRRGNFDFVPTVFVDTVYMEAPSDDSLADFDNDGVPEIAVGRLPVRTTDQAAVVVAKIVRYDQGGHTGRDVLLVADKNIDYDFEAESKTLYGLIPAGVTVNTVYRNEGPTDAAVRSRLLAALDQGPTIVNFFGHGATNIWTEASILRAADAAKLNNGRSLSLYLMMTCLNGYFVDPEGASLSEALVLAPNGGAIAAWSSTGLTVPTDQVRADQEAVRLLLNDPNMRLGDAMVSGKRVIRDIDVRHTWVLHGDPTTRLYLPPPTPQARKA